MRTPLDARCAIGEEGWSADAGAAVIAEIDALQSPLHEIELRLAGLGIPVAPLYLASARGSLAHAARCASRHAGIAERAPGEVGVGTGVVMVPVPDRAWVGVRHRRHGSRLVADPSADVAPWARAADLGADLLGSDAAGTLCAGPVGAALLTSALAGERWLHLETGAKWSTDLSGARALVAALTNGADFPIAHVGACDRLVDMEVIAALRRLGWSRLFSPSMPS